MVILPWPLRSSSAIHLIENERGKGKSDLPIVKRRLLVCGFPEVVLATPWSPKLYLENHWSRCSDVDIQIYILGSSMWGEEYFLGWGILCASYWATWRDMWCLVVPLLMMLRLTHVSEDCIELEPVCMKLFHPLEKRYKLFLLLYAQTQLILPSSVALSNCKHFNFLFD